MSHIHFFFTSVCPYGFFGQNCGKRCNETCTCCNNVNGSCEFGCIEGWRGYLCHEGSDNSGTFVFGLSF